MSRTMSSTTSATPQQQQGTTSIPREKIAQRAYEKWCKRGKPHGTDKQDWTEAEIEIKAEMMRMVGAQAGQNQSRR
jgi:Protein of unknown function (DUF2934)